MGKITLDLVRKCAEHNEGELSTLEEMSLHQRDLEKIEHIHRWCPRLRILLLQGNLISKIENVHRLRELEYLNLALNNIEKIEGLEKCESLTKLDFTANFITHLTSLTTLQDLPNLSELYLTGNPCTSYQGYRVWVICALPGLQELDGIAVTRSERLRALQQFLQADSTIREDQQIAIEKRAREKAKHGREAEIKANCSDSVEMTEEEWWNSSSEHTPEARLTFHRELQERRKKQENSPKKKKGRPLRLFTADGRPLNVNAARLNFLFKEDEENNSFVLEVETYRYLDPSLVTCDVEPWYVRVTVKGNILQLVLLEEVKPGQSSAKRSSITGHLVMTMPKLLPSRLPHGKSGQIISLEADKKKKEKTDAAQRETSKEHSEKGSNYLEIGDFHRSADYANIVRDAENQNSASGPFSHHENKKKNANEIPERPNSPGFIDDENVPPLE